jgi:hypothetical protein
MREDRNFAKQITRSLYQKPPSIEGFRKGLFFWEITQRSSGLKACGDAVVDVSGSLLKKSKLIFP